MPEPVPQTPARSPWRRARRSLDYAVVALVALVPMLASRPGTVSDDTKTYLYLDPGRYVRQAATLWDPNVALGTVTHENIGYLLPMGPFYWAMAELHVPLWTAQRLWMAAILFGAGAGVVYLCRTVGLLGPGRYVAALAFMLTPYVIQYAGRISVILLPWAGLPWMLAFTMLALRRGGWRYPALFALVVALVSGINASSILYVGIAPVLWLVTAVVVGRDATWGRAWAAAWRIGLLSALVSLWWAVGLQVEAAYGVNVLKYTESVQATSGASVASEVLRGLGYWYFYGTDRLGNWTQASVAYTQNLWLVAASFVVPLLAFVAAVFTRWRHRAYFVLLVLVGVALSVGANPYGDPSGLGSLLKAFMTETTAGLAMRSTDRATPLVVLGLAVLLGAGLSAVATRARAVGLALSAVAAGAVGAAAIPLLTGAVIANGFVQPASPPPYVTQAASYLDSTHPDSRVYALPGNDFAAYRWGDTIDTVYPGLLDRPFVTHEQQVYGSLPTADLLHAIDTPLQEGTMDWSALAPVASLMSAGDVLVQYDQAYERYDTPNPQVLASELATTPAGLSDPVSFGAPVPNVPPTVATLGEGVLGLAPSTGWTSPLVDYTVAAPRPITRSESLDQPLVVDGDADGIVSAAAMGLLAGNPTVLYAGTLDTDPSLRAAVLGQPADLVVTDTNRKQGFQWNAVQQNTGATLTAAQGPDTDVAGSSSLDLFPGAPADAQSTTAYTGITSVTASSYGSSLTYLPEDRPFMALDGNLDTAWTDDAFAAPVGQWWQTTLAAPTTATSVTLIQPQGGDPNRWITGVTLSFDGHRPVAAELGPSSRAAGGQTITFGPRRFTTLRVTIDGTAGAVGAGGGAPASAVGFAEVAIPGVHATEAVALPSDLLHAAGTGSLLDRLTLVLTRLRSSGMPPRSDPEPALVRQFWLPTARTFSLAGQARISPLVPDDEIDRLVGRPGADHTGVVAYSQGRLPGDLTAGAVATIDGDPSTVWQPGLGAAHQAGEWLEYQLPKPISFDRADLQIVADGMHSVPTSVTISAGSDAVHLTLPPIADGTVPGATVSVPLSFPTLTGRSVRITFDTVRLVDTVNYYSQEAEALPLGIAEVGIPGLSAAPVPAVIPATCRDDLLTVDGRPIWVAVSGTSAAALDRQPLDVSLCGPDAGGLALGPGTHTLASTDGHAAGFDLDLLTLDSASGGGPQPPVGPSQLAPPPVTPGPATSVLGQTATTEHVRITGVTGTPFALVLGQSVNAGWQASVDGGPSLGAPVLIDGFANGYRVVPAALGGAVHDGTIDVTLVWAPQRGVDVALVVSAAAIVACLALAFVPRRWWAWAARRVRGGWRRARRRAGHRRSRPVGEAVGDPGPGPGPVVDVPFRTRGPRSPVWVALVVGLVSGGVAAGLSRPVTGGLVAVAVVIALLVPATRVVLGWIATACIAAAAVYVIGQQRQFHWIANGLWPQHFALAGSLTWAGVVFLSAEAVVGAVQDRRGRSPVGARPVGADPP